MYGKILNTIINIMFITYLLLLVSFYFLHEGVKENINNINYTTVDTVSNQGVFGVDLYNNLKEKIFNYAGPDCNYTITIKYQEKVGSGVYNTHFLKDTVSADNMYYPDEARVEAYNKKQKKASDKIDLTKLLDKVDPDRIITSKSSNPRAMYKGDIITIYLEDQNQTLYGKLISTPFMGMLDSYIDFRIKSLKSAMIGRDANKLVNGYEVIDEINSSVRDYKVILITELSSQLSLPGKTYAKGQTYDESAHADEKAIKGSTSSSTIGNYHIFGSLNYYRVWDDGGATTGASTKVDGILNQYDIVTFYQTTE